jgi:hypothetical protein
MVIGRHDVERSLARYRDFEDCLLEEVRWRYAGRVMELELGYIWGDGPDCPVLDEPRHILVRLNDAIALRIESPLTPAMLAQPERLNWGIKGIAQLRLARQSELLPRPAGIEDALQLVAVWEGHGRIDILFRGLSIEEVTIEP